MADNATIEVSPVMPEDGLNAEEKKFLELTSKLIEQTVQLGLIPFDPETSEIHGDLGEIWEPLNQQAEKCYETPGLVQEIILPLADIWHANQGRSPGRLGGFFGSMYVMRKTDANRYQLNLYGVD